MRYFPVNLDIQGRKCLVAGGGAVAARKVKSLCECGGDVLVVSPDAVPDLTDRAEAGAIRLLLREYRESDMTEDLSLVFAATDNAEVNRKISEDAARHGILCNAADRQEASNFNLPAVIRRGDLVLTVSTSGKSPAMSRILRRELSEQFGEEYAEALEIMGKLRHQLLAEGHDPDGHRRKFRAVLENGLVERLRVRDRKAVSELIADIFGDRFRIDPGKGLSWK